MTFLKYRDIQEDFENLYGRRGPVLHQQLEPPEYHEEWRIYDGLNPEHGDHEYFFQSTEGDFIQEFEQMFQNIFGGFLADFNPPTQGLLLPFLLTNLSKRFLCVVD